MQKMQIVTASDSNLSIATSLMEARVNSYLALGYKLYGGTQYEALYNHNGKIDAHMFTQTVLSEVA
jgi:hypothetical protein